MNDAEVGVDTDGINVVYASNRDAGDLNAAGKLTIVFNRAVQLVDETQFTATITACTNSAGPCVGVLDGNAASATATLSTDGLTLELVPNYSTGLDAGDTAVTITYVLGSVNAAEGVITTVNVGALTNVDGSGITGVVNVIK